MVATRATYLPVRRKTRQATTFPLELPAEFRNSVGILCNIFRLCTYSSYRAKPYALHHMCHYTETGLLQSVHVRASGLSLIPLVALAWVAMALGTSLHPHVAAVTRPQLLRRTAALSVWRSLGRLFVKPLDRFVHRSLAWLLPRWASPPQSRTEKNQKHSTEQDSTGLDETRPNGTMRHHTGRHGAGWNGTGGNTARSLRRAGQNKAMHIKTRNKEKTRFGESERDKSGWDETRREAGLVERPLNRSVPSLLSR